MAAAYSVGQQIAIAVCTALIGLGAIVFIFGFRSFGEVLHAGRASQEAERAADRAGRTWTPRSRQPRRRGAHARVMRCVQDGAARRLDY